MPRQYVSVGDFCSEPMGLALGAPSLPPGTVAKVLFRASARCDCFCRRKLVQCGTTTLAAAATPGATTLSLTSSLGFDAEPDTVAQIGTGLPTQERLQCAGLHLARPIVAPYPGTLTLYQGQALANAHGAGETVQQFYYEQLNPLGASTSAMDQYFDFTQQGQVAYAHAPKWGLGQNIRTFFLKHTPILQLVAFATAYPWANVLDPATITDLFVEFVEGWLRLPIGYFSPPDSVIHVTYNGGFASVPEQVYEAVIFEAAAELGQSQNPYGVLSFKRADYAVNFRSGASNRDDEERMYSEDAKKILKDFRRLTM